MNYKELSETVKSTVINTLDVVKENIRDMSDIDVIKLVFNMPKDSICCCECKHCKGKDLKIPRCSLLHRDVTVTDFCSFGEREIKK